MANPRLYSIRILSRKRPLRVSVHFLTVLLLSRQGLTMKAGWSQCNAPASGFWASVRIRGVPHHAQCSYFSLLSFEISSYSFKGSPLQTHRHKCFLRLYTILPPLSPGFSQNKNFHLVKPSYHFFCLLNIFFSVKCKEFAYSCDFQRFSYTSWLEL